jgi:hypothetical protein
LGGGDDADAELVEELRGSLGDEVLEVRWISRVAAGSR